MGSERGQATVEWVGLLLLLALGLAALLSAASRVHGRSVGGALAQRMVCAARTACEAERRTAGAAALRASPHLVPGRPTRGPAPAVKRERVVAAFRTLRGLRAVARRTWILCLGYRRYRYELAHPELALPGRAMPVDEALRIANACLNPIAFAGEE